MDNQLEQSRAEQSRAEQSRAEQSRAEQSRAEQSRAEQSRAEQSRVLWIDACRGIGILLVMLGHCNSPFDKYIYGFHMPLFFILSGLVWKKQNFLVAFKKGICRYIIPYFILCLINLLLSMVTGALLSYERDSIVHYVIGIVYSRGTTEWMPNCSPLWFLTSLFVALLIVNLISKVHNKKTVIVLVIVSLTTGVVLDYFNCVKLPWNVDTALVAVPFIWIGIWIKNKGLEKIQIKQRKDDRWHILMILLIGSVAIYFNPVMIDFDANTYGNPFLMLTGATSVSLVTIIFSAKFGRIDNRLNGYISWLGRHTIFIMGFDYFSGAIARTLLSWVGMENWGLVFVAKLIILSAGCLIWNKLIFFLAEKISRNLQY